MTISNKTRADSTLFSIFAAPLQAAPEGITAGKQLQKMAGQQTNEISNAGLVKMIKEGIEWDTHFKLNRRQ